MWYRRSEQTNRNASWYAMLGVVNMVSSYSFPLVISLIDITVRKFIDLRSWPHQVSFALISGNFFRLLWLFRTSNLHEVDYLSILRSPDRCYLCRMLHLHAWLAHGGKVPQAWGKANCGWATAHEPDGGGISSLEMESCQRGSLWSQNLAVVFAADCCLVSIHFYESSSAPA